MNQGRPFEETASEKYHEFMLQLYDIMVEAVEDDYDEEAIAYLSNARRFFMKEFCDRHPEWAAKEKETQALWPDP